MLALISLHSLQWSRQLTFFARRFLHNHQAVCSGVLRLQPRPCSYTLAFLWRSAAHVSRAAAGAQGGRPIGRHPPLFASLGAQEAATAKPRALRVDYGFSGGPSCRDFWQASGPQQDQPPVTAWRQAVKATMLGGIQDKGVSAAVASISVICNDPAPEFQSDLRRLIITVTLTPALTLEELNLVDLGYRKLEFLGTLDDTFNSVAGDSSPFVPVMWDYSDGDTQYLCAVGLGGCPPLLWDPTSVVIL